MSFKIGKYDILKLEKPFLIAEMSANHQGDINVAKKIIKKAADAGATAIKFQTLNPETITLKCKSKDFIINDPKSSWDKRSLYDLYQEAQLPWEWHKELFDYSKALGLIPFSSPFDEDAVDFLETLDVDCYKIASFEITHHPLIRKVAKTKKPIIISTGLSSFSEIAETVELIESEGNHKIILLVCSSTYPADPKDSNLRKIPHLIDAFNYPVGLSDHTLGIGAAIASVALGGKIIEKHITLSTQRGLDKDFSLLPDDFLQLRVELDRAWDSLGTATYKTSERENKSRQFRRSIYIKKALRKGDTLTKENLAVVRPGFGLHPKYLNQVLGRKINKEMDIGTPLSWDDI